VLDKCQREKKSGYLYNDASGAVDKTSFFAS